MLKRINPSKTLYSDLYQVLGFADMVELEEKRSRLFPIGKTDNEIPTTSTFLSSLGAVKEFREELFLQLGMHKILNKTAVLHVFTEINGPEKHNQKEKYDRPDALLVITTGKNNPIIEWATFIESKVGNQFIESDQIQRYAELASDIGFDNIITISNQMVTNPNNSPVKIRKRKFNLFHWSWTYLKVTALRLIREKKIKDEDHQYILSELVRYFEHHSKINNFTILPQNWTESVNRVRAQGIEKKIAPELVDAIVIPLLQEEKDISMQLTQKSDFYVELLNQKNRKEKLSSMLLKNRIITSDYMINGDKNCSFKIDIDFIRQEIKCSTQLLVTSGKAQAQVTKVLGVLKGAGTADKIMIAAVYKRKKSKDNPVSLSNLLEEKGRTTTYSIVDKSLGSEIKYFEITTIDALYDKFAHRKKFIIEIENIAIRFLTQVMSNIVKLHY